MELSYFKHFRDTSPSTTDMEAVVRMIRDDQSLRHLTESHRSDPGKGLKDLCPLFAVPSLFKDGKAKSHIVALTGLSLVDIDHVDTAGAIPLDELKSRIEADPHTLLCYTTVSGHGLRVIYRYDLDPSYDLQRQMQFYPKAFAHGNAYYARLLGVETDGQCKDVTRLSVMCHDPTVLGVDGGQVQSVVQRQKHERHDDIAEDESQTGLHIRHIDPRHHARHGDERHARDARPDHAEGHQIPR